MSNSDQQKVINDLLDSDLVRKKWHLADQFTQIQRIEKFANIVAQSYLRERAPNARYFSVNANLGFSFGGVGASYSSSKNRILLHENDAFRTTRDRIALVAHEATHHGQFLLCQKDISELTPDAIEKRLTLSTNVIPYASKVFGIETGGMAYVHTGGSKYFDPYHELRESMYRLCPIEREARMEELRITKELGLPSQKAQQQINHAVDCFRDRYHCQHLSAEEIFKKYDQAIINVATGRVPQDVIEASMTYDFAAIIYGQKDRKHHQEAQRMLGVERKSEAMSKAGFENTMLMSQRDVKKMSLDSLLKMTDSMIVQNPHAIAHGICKYGMDAIMRSESIAQLFDMHTIGDTSFDRWYFSEQNNLSAEQIEEIAGVFGDAYSMNNIQLVISNGGFQQDMDSEINLDELFATKDSPFMQEYTIIEQAMEIGG